MILDINLVLSAAQALTVTAQSTNVIDLAGLGVGNPVTNIFGVQNTSFGEDIGGGGPAASAPQILAKVGTAFTAGGAATMSVALEAAVDTTNSGTPGTWKTLLVTDAVPVASLVAGAQIGNFTIPDRYLGQNFPRFYRLTYTIASGPMLTGTMNAYIATGIDDAISQQYPSGY